MRAIIAAPILFAASFITLQQDRDLRTVPGQASAGKKWALVIGIDKYEDSSISQLKFASADAKLIQATLTDPKSGGFPPNSVVLMIDTSPASQKPTRANVMARLRSLTEVPAADDTVVFYFSGHGVEEGGKTFLLPMDARADAASDTGIDAARVRELIQNCKAKKKVLVFDSCHSGSGKGSEQMSAAMAGTLLSAAEGIVTFASCDVNQRSYEWDEKGHGVFTYFFAEGLKGAADRDADGVVTADELKRYVDQTVREWSVQNGKLQVPRVVANVAGDIPLSRPGVPVKSEPPKADPPKTEPARTEPPKTEPPKAEPPATGAPALIRSFEAPSDNLTMALSPDGKTLATAGRDNVVRLYEIASDKPRKELKGHGMRVNALAFSRDGSRLASASQDLTIRIWNVKDGSWYRTLTDRGVYPVESVAYASSGLRLFSGHGNGQILVWDARTGALEKRIDRHSSAINALSYSPTGYFIASAGSDETVRIGNANTDIETAVLTGHKGKVFAVAFSPADNSLASGGEDGTVRIWKPGGGKQKVLEGHKGPVRSLAYSKDGAFLASGDGYGRVIVWDMKKGEPLKTIEWHRTTVSGVAFMPDGSALITAGQDKRVAFWNLSN